MNVTMETPLKYAHRLLAPRIAYLVTSISRHGRSNVAAFTNITSVSTDPQQIVLAVCPRWTTFKNIQATKEFVINIPGENLLRHVWVCGDKYAGNPIPSELDKISVAGLTKLASTQVRPPRLAECYAYLECRVRWTRSTGNHRLFLADVVAARHRKGAFLEEMLLNVGVNRPVMQISGPHFTFPTRDILLDVAHVRSMVTSRISKERSKSNR